MSVGSIRDEFQRQLDVAQEIMERRSEPLKQLEGRPMAAPNVIKGLPSKFRDLLAELTARAEKLAGEVEGSVKNLHERLDDADKMKKEIDNTAAEMQKIVGMDNGGPA